MLFVFTVAVLGAAGCDNAASKSQTSSGVSGAANSNDGGGKIKTKVGPGTGGSGSGS
jgi:hypothetical protein